MAMAAAATTATGNVCDEARTSFSETLPLKNDVKVQKSHFYSNLFRK